MSACRSRPHRSCIKGPALGRLRSTDTVRNNRIGIKEGHPVSEWGRSRAFLGTVRSSSKWRCAVRHSFQLCKVRIQASFWKQMAALLLTSWPWCLVFRRQKPAYTSLNTLQCLLCLLSFAYITCSSFRQAVGQSSEFDEWAKARAHCRAGVKTVFEEHGH